jgi:chaperone modulatory protein CbpM
MIPVQEFLLRARLDRVSLEAWISAGWLIPPQMEGELTFSEVDLARAQLIRDLREDIGVNDEGVSVILHLLDQVHGLRRSMQELLDAMRGGARQRTVARSPRRRARR